MRVLGVDPSEGYLVAARQAAADLRFEAVVGSATDIPAADGQFDRVVSALVLNFVPQPDQALAEMRRVARPSGLIGTMPSVGFEVTLTNGEELEVHNPSDFPDPQKVAEVREPFVRGAAHEGGEEPVEGGFHQAIGELVTCSRCVGTWAAAGLATTQILSPRFGRLLTWSLAAAGANDFLQAAFAAITSKSD